MKLPRVGWYWVKTVLSAHSGKWIAVAFTDKCAYYLGALNGTHAGSITLDEIVELGEELTPPE